MNHIPVLAVFVLVLGSVHLLVPRIGSWLSASSRLVGSLGGGMTSAYVFLHLLPEIDQGHEVLGERIYLFAMFGFLLFHGVEWLAWRRTRHAGPEARGHVAFSHRLLLGAIYNGIVLYSLPDAVFRSAAVLSLALITLVIHFLHLDQSLSERDERKFDRRGKFALVFGLGVGGLLRAASEPSAVVADVAIAILSGSALYIVFKEELPDHEEADYRLFLAGCFGYLGLLLGLDWLGAGA